MKTKNIIGVDVGGTTIVGGRVEKQSIESHLVESTQADIGGETTLRVIKELIAELINEETSSIGIGVPSVVDRAKGIVYNVQNINNWNEVHLKSILEKEFNIPVFIDNDANCFAMGERIFGEGRSYLNFVGITLGTGVGGGIIQNGYLLKDANCGSGEFGEVPYIDGILEEYCGSRFFPHQSGLTAHEASVLAREGDEKAIDLYKEYGRHMAQLVKIIMLTIDPQAIIFGGSIAKSFDLFEASLYEHLKEFPYPNSVKNINIMTSKLHNIGILGAAALGVL